MKRAGTSFVNAETIVEAMLPDMMATAKKPTAPGPRLCCLASELSTSGIRLNSSAGPMLMIRAETQVALGRLTCAWPRRPRPRRPSGRAFSFRGDLFIII